TLSPAHIGFRVGVWTVRKVDRIRCVFLSLSPWINLLFTHNKPRIARKDAMATPTKFSFSVRSILDLPERDAEAAPRSSPLYSSCSPYSSWMDCDRSPCLSPVPGRSSSTVPPALSHRSGLQIRLERLLERL
ncbi:hypothetical protein FQN60_008675, partial [Etheostoma spectabile]